MGLFGSSEGNSHEEIVSRGGFKQEETINTAQKRVVDEEAGVVLYAAMSPKQGLALAAVPIDDTKLEVGDEER